MLVIADKIFTAAYKEPLQNHVLRTRGSYIVEIGPLTRMIGSHRRESILRLNHSILLPGLVNVHTHLELPDFGIRRSNRSYASWVLSLLKARSTMHQVNYASAVRANLKEIIGSGTTTVADISTHGISGRIIRSSGLRAIVYEEIISMHPKGKIAFPRSFRSSYLVRRGLSPHSPHTVSEASLRIINNYSKIRGLPLCMHVAESKDEQLLFVRKKSSLDKLYSAARWDRDWAPQTDSTFRYLSEIGILRSGFLAVHAVHATSKEIQIVAKSGASIAHCPRSNHALHVGSMDLCGMLDAGITVGLGTDSLASSPSLNLWDEMRFAHRQHRNSGITAQDILQMATMGGAKTLEMENDIGSLEPGKKADIIAVSLPSRDTGDICSDLLRETKSSIMTMVNGKILYQREG